MPDKGKKKPCLLHNFLIAGGVELMDSCLSQVHWREVKRSLIQDLNRVVNSIFYTHVLSVRERINPHLVLHSSDLIAKKETLLISQLLVDYFTTLPNSENQFPQPNKVFLCCRSIRWCVLFNGISTFLDYLMPKTSY